jgi:ABC-type uncharacterized transport system substrate-binding protein
MFRELGMTFWLEKADAARGGAWWSRAMTRVERRGFIVGTLSLLAAPLAPEAQQAGKVPRIGFLGVTSLSTISARIAGFRQGLRELGYVEGSNVVIEYRWAEGKAERLPDLADELVRLKVDVIVTGGPADTRAAQKATAAIPIVMGFDNDPVGSGFVASLGRPGGNITGLSTLSPELSGKRLQLLKEVIPRLSRVAVFGTSIQAGNTQSLRETELAAKELGIQLQYVDILDPKDIETAFRTAGSGRTDALLVLQSPVFNLGARSLRTSRSRAGCRACTHSRSTWSPVV